MLLDAYIVQHPFPGRHNSMSPHWAVGISSPRRCAGMNTSAVTSTIPTARCGSACRVVWEGRGRFRPPPILIGRAGPPGKLPDRDREGLWTPSAPRPEPVEGRSARRSWFDRLTASVDRLTTPQKTVNPFGKRARASFSWSSFSRSLGTCRWEAWPSGPSLQKPAARPAGP